MLKDHMNYARRYQESIPQNHCIQLLLLAIWCFGIGHSWNIFKIFLWTYLCPGCNGLLLKVGWRDCIDFICMNIIDQYRVPCYIITNNSKPFCNVVMKKLCEKFSEKLNFKQYNLQFTMLVQMDSSKHSIRLYAVCWKKSLTSQKEICIIWKSSWNV